MPLYLFIVSQQTGKVTVIGPFNDAGAGMTWFDERRQHFGNYRADLRTLDTVAPEEWKEPTYSFTPH